MPDSTFGVELLRFRVWFPVYMPDGEGEIWFNAHGPVLPRIGERPAPRS
ncbi:hypothetical protein [Nocardia sp. NPDC051832]